MIGNQSIVLDELKVFGRCKKQLYTFIKKYAYNSV